MPTEELATGQVINSAEPASSRVLAVNEFYLHEDHGSLLDVVHGLGGPIAELLPDGLAVAAPGLPGRVDVLRRGPVLEPTKATLTQQSGPGNKHMNL